MSRARHLMRLLFERSYRANIPKVLIYQFMLNFLLFLPFWVIYLQQRLGLNITQATLVDVSFWFGMTLTEIPTGAVADTVGRKPSILIGMLTISLATFLFALAPGFGWMLLANSLWAVGFTFDSGAGSSLMYESLKQFGEESRYGELRGYMDAAMLASIGLAALVGGWIAERWMAGTFYIYGVIVLLGIIFVLLLKEPPFEPDPDTGERITYFKAVRLAFETIWQTPNLRYITLYDKILPLSVISVAALFIQPHAQALGITFVGIGIAVFYLRLTRMLGSLSSGRLIRRVGAWRWIHLAPVIVVLGTLALGLIPTWLGILLFGIGGMAQAATYPLDESLLLNATPGPVRATVLSISSLVLTLFISLFEPGFGMLADARGTSTTFVVMSLVLALLLVIVLLLWRRVWDGSLLLKKAEAVPPSIADVPER